MHPTMTAGRSPSPCPVYLESGARRVFVCAIDWPGWCRSGRDEHAALEAFAAAVPRYAAVAAEAGVGAGRAFSKASSAAVEVTERLAGSATTDFGAPGAVPTADSSPLSASEATRLSALVAACWVVFDKVVAGAPSALRKGPRGGGRDRQVIVEHVLAAEVAYARKLGIRTPQPPANDQSAVGAHRQAILDVISLARRGDPPVAKGWPPRYAARRIAWHVLDHAWEIEDRTP
jgi:hypothetical protein